MGTAPKPAPLRFGVFELDPITGELRRQGVRLKLHDKAVQLLHALLERPGELVTRQELQRRLWPEDTFVEFDNNLNNAISRLREAVGDSADSPRFIETLPRRGYRFIASVEPAQAPESRMTAEPPPSTLAASSPARYRWMLVPALAALLVGGWFAYRTLKASSHPIQSVAVLPFVTAAAEGSRDEYVAFGMTEALIAELSRMGELKVISQTSVLGYKETGKPLPQIARELGVGAVVEGSVVSEGDQVRITVQLIEAESDSHLWAETFRRDPEDVLAMQGELAQSIARDVATRLTGKPAVPPRRPRPVNAKVQEAYLKGRFFMARGTEEGRARGRTFFEEALALDAGHAPSHAGLADYYILTDSLPPETAVPKAKARALKALELDEALVEAHASLGFVHLYGEWDWAAAERELRRAIELNPGHSRARRWYVLFLAYVGRDAEARRQAERVLELDPVSIPALDAVALTFTTTRNFDRVAALGQKILDLDADDVRGYEHLMVGNYHASRFAHAHAAVEKGLALESHHQPALFRCFLAMTQHRLGDTGQARKTLREVEAMAAKEHVPDFFVALSWAQVDDPERAFQWLERAYARRDPYLVLLKTTPWLDPLRGDARYQRLLARMDFPP